MCDQPEIGLQPEVASPLLFFFLFGTAAAYSRWLQAAGTD
jgi:hypothetical protein